jgi:gliding motility-associated lipoprotein GldK
MKNFILSTFLILIVMGCKSGDKGELVGVSGKEYFSEKPFGMALVPGGSFIMGKSDDDLVGIQNAPTKTVTVRSFYMDETEITNAEYRQFVYWVRDSIIKTKLAEEIGDYLEVKDATNAHNMNQFAYLGVEEDNTEMTADERYAYDAAVAKKRLNWGVELIFDDNDYPSGEVYKDIIERMRLSKDETFNNVGGWNVEDFKYQTKSFDIEAFLKVKEKGGYTYVVDGGANQKTFARIMLEKYRGMDYDVAMKLVSQPNPNDLISLSQGDIYDMVNTQMSEDIEFQEDQMLAGLPLLEDYLIKYTKTSTKDIQRKDYIKTDYREVYPDTTVWITDFKYSYNEPMHNDYFWRPAYDDYPVVGITWEQASAFCIWRTNYKNGSQKNRNKDLVPNFRLPTEAEWEYAARGGLQGATFPWGGPYAKNDEACFLANFKPMRGDYAADAAFYTVEGDAYPANGYGLYNMSGNVAEWVNSSYEEDAYDFSSTLNPNVNNKDNNKKITRGGSWKDVKYFLQVSSRDYEYEDVPRSFIGFRTVHDYLGTDITLNAQTNSSRVKR